MKTKFGVAEDFLGKVSTKYEDNTIIDANKIVKFCIHVSSDEIIHRVYINLTTVKLWMLM